MGSTPSRLLRSSSWERVRSSTPPASSFSPQEILRPLLSSGHFSPRLQNEIRSLSEENHPEIFFSGLLGLGRRLVREGQMETAVSLFQVIQQRTEDFALRRESESELNAILGRGDLGLRWEFLGRSLAREATHPVTLGSMALGGLAFSATRAGVLSRLLSGPTGIFSRGFTARALASSYAFAAEVPTFVFSSRIFHEAAGIRQDWSPGAIGRDLAANVLILGALKLSGWGASALSQWGRLGQDRFLRGLIQQTGMFAGIMAGHRAEELFGLRPHQDNATMLADSLAFLIQFNVSGRLMHQAMGPRWAGMQRELEIRAEELGRDSHRPGRSFFPHPRLAPLGPSWERSHAELLRPWMMMANQGGEGGPRRPGESVGNRETLESASQTPQATSVPAKVRTSLPATFLGYSPGTRIGPQVPGRNGSLGGRYEIIRQIGQGGRAKVYQVLDHKNGRFAAIKIPIEVFSAEDMAHFEKEIWISENLASPWAVTIYDHFELKEGSGINVPVMEFVEGRSLIDVLMDLDQGNAEWVKSFPLERRLEFFGDLCLGVQDVHQHRFTHNDLKPGNLMVDRLYRARIFDWDLARHVDDPRTEGRSRLSSHALSLKPQTQTATGDHSGTMGYFPPELGTKQAHEDPLAQDIFSLGVILYELATLRHPMGEFRAGNGTNGEPRLVPLRVMNIVFDAEGREQERPIIKIDRMKASFFGQSPELSAPAFQDILSGNQPDYMNALEAIARKAMAWRPEERYRTVTELREAVLMARPRAKYQHLRSLHEDISQSYARMSQTWLRNRDGVEPPPQVWEKLHRPVEEIRERHRLWEHGVIQLLQDLAGVIGSSNDGTSWSEAHRMIAELNWQLLNDQFDYLPAGVRADYIAEIRLHDLSGPGREPSAISRSLSESIPVHLRLTDRETDREMSGDAELEVIPWIRELGADGRETGNYIPSDPVFAGKFQGGEASVSLPVGYYAARVRSMGYPETFLPLHITLEDVRSRLEGTRAPFSRNVSLVPAARLGPAMRFIPEGEATIGLNIFAGHENLVTAFGFPARPVLLPAMAMSEHSVTVGEYKEMVEDVLRTQGRDAAEQLIPRIIRSNAARIRAIVKPETGLLGWGQGLLRRISGAFTQAGKSLVSGWRRENEKGYQLFWTIRDRGWWRLRDRYELLDPTTHLDPNGDPIFLDQPISSISYQMADAYIGWRSRRDGIEYRMPSIVELEAVTRNYFPWKFSYGNNLNPLSVVSRQVFADKTLTYPQRIGTHPLGAESNRDHTIFGVEGLMGNVREFSSTPGEINTVAIFGGSVGAVTGPYYYPSSRNFLVVDRPIPVVGAFRLVQVFPSSAASRSIPETAAKIAQLIK